MEDCIIFSGRKNSGGYGYIGHSEGVYMAHRLAWMLYNGFNVPKGKVIMHTCDNPPCINPCHLVLGKHKDNTQDCINRGRAKHGLGGRPPKITQDMIEAVDGLRQTGMSAKSACQKIGMSRAQYNNLKGRKYSQTHSQE